MAEQRHLDNPPIVEAIFRILVKGSSPDVKLEQVKELNIPGEWRRKESFEAKFQIGKRSEATVSEAALAGFALFSPTQAKPSDVLEFEFSGFTFHKLPTYVDFDECLERLLIEFQQYVGLFKPTSIIGTSLRFLNLIRIPRSATFNYGEYFEINMPASPKWKPVGTISTLSTKIGFEAGDGMTAQVLLTLRHPTSEGSQDISLDLTVRKDEIIGIDDSLRLRSAFVALRSLKNNIFFGSVTEKTLTLFDK